MQVAWTLLSWCHVHASSRSYEPIISHVASCRCAPIISHDVDASSRSCAGEGDQCGMLWICTWHEAMWHTIGLYLSLYELAAVCVWMLLAMSYLHLRCISINFNISYHIHITSHYHHIDIMCVCISSYHIYITCVSISSNHISSSSYHINITCVSSSSHHIYTTHVLAHHRITSTPHMC